MRLRVIPADLSEDDNDLFWGNPREELERLAKAGGREDREAQPIDHEATLRAANFAAAICERVLPDFVVLWNERHNTDYPETYWRLIGYPWLLDIAQAIVKKVDEFRVISNRDGGVISSAIIFDDGFSQEFTNHHDFVVSALLDPDYHLWLASQVVDELAPESWSVDKVPLVQDKRELPQPAPLVAGSLRFIRSAIAGGVRGRLLEQWSRVASIFARPAEINRPESELTFDTDAFYDFDRVSKILKNVASVCETEVFKTRFAELDTYAKSKSYRPGAVQFVGNRLYYDEHVMFVAAHGALAGEKIVPSQHGAQYGVEHLILNAREIEYKQFALVTWGWTKHTHHPGRFYPCPSPQLSKLPKQEKPGQGLILVGQQVRPQHFRIASAPVGVGWLNYCDKKIDLISGLDATVRKDLRFRPAAQENGEFNEMEYLNNAVGKLEVVGGRLIDAMVKSKLVIVDYPGTCFLEALVSNTPVIGCWSQDHFPWADNAQEDLQRLKSVGMYEDDPKALASRLNDNWDNINGWWNSRDVQNARLAFCQKYADTDPSWFWSWFKMIWALNRTKSFSGCS